MGGERWRLCFLVIAVIAVGHMGSQRGLIRLRGHLPPLASYLGPWDSGPRYWGPRCLTGSKIISGRQRMEEKWLFFQSKRKLLSANLLLCPGNLVLLRSVFIPVHEEQSCVLTCCYTLHNKDNILHLQLDTKQGKLMRGNPVKSEPILHTVLAVLYV